MSISEKGKSYVSGTDSPAGPVRGMTGAMGVLALQLRTRASISFWLLAGSSTCTTGESRLIARLGARAAASTASVSRELPTNLYFASDFKPSLRVDNVSGRGIGLLRTGAADAIVMLSFNNDSDVS